MNNHIVVVLATVFLTLASMSHAQTARAPFSAKESQACRSLDSDRAKKQEELGRIQTRISNLMAAMTQLREGQARQEQIASLGKLQAGMGGTAGVAKVTKAFSDAFLEITQPAAPMVKKAYDAVDAMTAAGIAFYQGNAVKGSAGALDGGQKGMEAYIQYVDLQNPKTILPQNPKTPGLAASVLKTAERLDQGDFAGAASAYAGGVEQQLNSKAHTSKGLLRAGANAAAVFSNAPGKTAEERVADYLKALSEINKVAAEAHKRFPFQAEGLADRAGRVLGHSGAVLTQIPKAREGYREAVDMYVEYKAIEARAAGTVRNMERQIEQKYEEVKRLHAQGLKIENEIRRVDAKTRACLDSEEKRLVKAGSSKAKPRAPAASANNSYQVPKKPAWNRQATWQRLDRAREYRRQADERAMAGGSAPSLTPGPANRAGTPTPQPKPVPPLQEMETLCSDVACQ
jgi:cell division protein FtsB